MKTSVVITSIFEPSTAIWKFVDLFNKKCNHEVIVIGDIKTPKNWSCQGVRYIDVEEQEKMSFNLSKHLPYNHYSRKMIGYLDAMHRGANIIIDTDDDNKIKENWTIPDFDASYDTLVLPHCFVNVYRLYTDKKIWPRGFPLRLITSEYNMDLERNIIKRVAKVGVWQGLVDKDPDVDAIFRLTDNSTTYFRSRAPVVLSTGVISPFNSQNTIFRKECFPLLYLPAYVTFRFTDILRSFVAQPIMWIYGFQLGFLEATAIQDRNPHDYMKDFESEIPMYINGEKVINIIIQAIKPSETIFSNIHRAYYALSKEKIIDDKELFVLDAWLADIMSMNII